MLTLAYPTVLLLLPLPYFIWRFFPPHREPVTAIRIPFFRNVTAAAGVAPETGASVLDRTRFQMVVASLVWGLVVLALAKPERLGEPIAVETSARDMILALDISGSMDERDFISPDGGRHQRLEAVKEVMATFIDARDGDRIALIIFGTRAFVQAPFTEDFESLLQFLDQIEVGLAGPNTALGDAIGLSIRTFDASEVEEKVLILLSDGADTSSRMTPVNAATIATERGVVVHTIGVGNPEASGEEKVDLVALQDIADRTGGQYFFASDERALTSVYTELDRLAPRITETTSFRPRESLVHLPLALATLLVLIGTVTMAFKARKGIEG